MSIDTATIRILIDAGMGGEEILAVAEGMESGPDARIIFVMVEALRNEGCDAEKIADAVLATAEDIVRKRKARFAYNTDEHTPRKDSNKARRGLSNQRWRDLRDRIYERDGRQCQYCGDTNDLTCDHIVPLLRGGTNDESNLTIACRPCNSSKGDKLLSEWRGLQ